MNAEPRGPSRPRRPLEADLPFMTDMGDEDDWRPPANLSAPEPLPGMVQRWVRTGIRGEDDVSNLYRMRQLGWEPRPADTVKSNFAPPTIKHGEMAGFIGIHNMVLMHMPKERAERLKMRSDAMTRRLTETIDRDIMKVQSKQVPFTQDRQSRVTGGSRQPRAMEDS